MYLETHLNPLALSFGIGLLTVLPGAWTISQTSVAGLGHNIAVGEAQRIYESRFTNNFPLASEARAAWAAFRLAAFDQPATGAVMGADGVLFTAEEFTTPAPHPDLATALINAQAELAAHGAELIPVFVPDKARMLHTALPRARSDKFNNRYDALLQMASKLGLRTVDLRPVLSTKTGDASRFLQSDTHWSPEGAEAAARAIATLFETPIENGSAFETVRTGTRSFEGDLTVFANTGRWQPFVGPAKQTIGTYQTTARASEDSSANDLFGDVEIPVALVGTSFSARSDLHFEGFLKTALQSDLLLNAIEGRGPFHPMDLYLAQLSSMASPPSIVIWEIPERYINTWSTSQ